jgi:hypothetical protein
MCDVLITATKQPLDLSYSQNSPIAPRNPTFSDNTWESGRGLKQSRAFRPLESVPKHDLTFREITKAWWVSGRRKSGIAEAAFVFLEKSECHFKWIVYSQPCVSENTRNHYLVPTSEGIMGSAPWSFWSWWWWHLPRVRRNDITLVITKNYQKPEHKLSVTYPKTVYFRIFAILSE